MQAHLLVSVILSLIFMTELLTEINHRLGTSGNYFVSPLTIDLSGLIGVRLEIR